MNCLKELSVVSHDARHHPTGRLVLLDAVVVTTQILQVGLGNVRRADGKPAPLSELPTAPTLIPPELKLR